MLVGCLTHAASRFAAIGYRPTAGLNDPFLQRGYGGDFGYKSERV